MNNEEKCINTHIKICSVKSGFSVKAILTDIENLVWP